MDSVKILSDIKNCFMGLRNEHVLYLSLPQNIMDSLPDQLGTEYTVVNAINNLSPLVPFLGLLKDVKPADKIVRDCVYSLQVNTFLSYFHTGVAETRQDAFIHEEVYYERIRCQNAVVELLEKCYDKNAVILNAQELSADSIDVLRKVSASKKFRGKLIFCFNIECSDSSSTEVTKFIEEIYNDENFFEITDFEGNRVRENIDYNDRFSKTVRSDDLENAVTNLMGFVALKQGRQVIDFYKNYQKNLDMTLEATCRVNFEMSRICFYAGDYDEASFFLNNVIESQCNEILLGSAYLYLSYVLIMKNSASEALRYIKLALQILEKHKDNYNYALAYQLYYKITERNDEAKSIDEYHTALSLLEIFGLTNNYINVSLIVPFALVNDTEGRKLLMPTIDEVIKNAEQLKNEFALSTAYHWKGLILSRKGNQDKGLEWYLKCCSIRQQIGEVSSLIKISNGLCYEYFIRSDYKEAYNLINNIVNRIDEINDYSELVITLTNMAKTLFFARNFKQANILFHRIIKFMVLFDLDSSGFNTFLPEKNDIMLFRAIIAFMNEDYIRAHAYFHNVDHNGKKISNICIPFKFFLNALIELKEQNLEKAIELFYEAESISKNYGIGEEHQIVFMYMEFAVILNKLGYKGYKEHAVRFFEQGEKLARQCKLGWYLQDKKKGSVEEYEKLNRPFDALNIDLNYLEEVAQKEKMVNQLHKRLRDSQFLNKILAFGNEYVEERKYADHVVQATFEYTMAISVYLAEVVAGKWEIISQISRGDFMDKPSQRDWNDLLVESHRNGNAHLVFNRQKNMIFGDISKFDFKGGVIIVPSGETKFTGEDHAIVNIAISNLQAQLVMMRQNKHLLFISSTDELSMLKNRHALEEKLACETEMVKRYQKKQNSSMLMSITFIDLDNFKYYNDTYGHDIGDLMIESFGKLLKKVYRRVDFVSRYGGDEFVILLPSTNCQESVRAAERVKEELVAQNYFIPAIEEAVKHPVHIPPDKYLGFSTGICSNFDVEPNYDMERTMANADKALYYTKEHNKGGITIWLDIKDKVEGNCD